MRQRFRVLFLTVLLGLPLACTLPSEHDADGARPLPTENPLDDEDEERAHEARREWVELLHRAARGVDWREIERANAQAEVERRNQLAATTPSWLVAPNHWSEVGSRNQAGRTHVAALGVDAFDNPQLYLGTDLGGVWRGNLDGTGWVPLADNVYGGVQEMVVLPGEHAGEPDFLLVAAGGGLAHASRDSGTTWQVPAGLPNFLAIRSVVALNDAARTILVLGTYNPGSGTRSSVWRSSDYGRTFARHWLGTQNWNGDLWVPRVGATAATHAYLLDRGQLHVSTDGGASFAPGAVIDATATRGVLCGSEAGAPTLYVGLQTATTPKLHRSTNGGSTFTFVGDIANSYYDTLCASTLNPNLVMYGGLEVWRSLNGGASFTRINSWGQYYADPAHKLHADSFGIDVLPDPAGTPSLEHWYIATDGGTYLSLNGSQVVQNLCLSGIGIGQYYSTLSSRTNPALCLAGAQDQGYQRGLVQAPLASGPSSDFAQLISGDYGHLTSGDGTHALVYSTYPGFVLAQVGETNPVLSQVSFPAGATSAWLPPVIGDPLDNSRFFFPAQRLYRYTRTGPGTWTSAQWSTFDFTVGGAAWMSALDFAPADPQRAYGANDRGRLFWSTDHGVTWNLSSSTGGTPQYFYGQDVEANPTNPLVAVVGGSGYSTAGVRRTQDGGITWQALTTGLPATLVYDLAWSIDGSDDIYAATESGPYRYDADHSQWIPISENRTPMTTYWSVEIVNQGRTARFGTYGRGIWDFELPPPPPLYLGPPSRQ